MAVTKAQEIHEAAAPLASTKATAPAAPASAGQSNKPPVDALILAYMMIFHSVLMHNQTAEREAKQLQTNAAMQNNMINEENGFSFIVCGNDTQVDAFLKAHPSQCRSDLSWYIASVSKGRQHIVAYGTLPFSKVENNVLNDVVEINQSTTATRSIFENKLNMARQDAQLGEANLNTAANQSSNGIQEDGSLMQMLASLTNQISQI